MIEKITKEETKALTEFLISLHEEIIKESGGLNGVRDEGGIYNSAYKVRSY